MDQVASRNLGGGGGGANRPNMAVAEILADAAQSAAMGQEALAGRDFETAQIHVRDLTRHLDQAQRAAAMPMARVASADKQRIQALKRQAQTLDSQVSSRSNSAVRTAGNLVTQIGRDLPHFAQAPAGGGAGMPMNR